MDKLLFPSSDLPRSKLIAIYFCGVAFTCNEALAHISIELVEDHAGELVSTSLTTRYATLTNVTNHTDLNKQCHLLYIIAAVIFEPFSQFLTIVLHPVSQRWVLPVFLWNVSMTMF